MTCMAGRSPKSRQLRANPLRAARPPAWASAPEATTNKQWFGFFAALLWCCTKVAGLGLRVTGLPGLGSVLVGGFPFWPLVLPGALPIGLGLLLPKSDFVYDLATAEQVRRQGGRCAAATGRVSVPRRAPTAPRTGPAGSGGTTAT